MFLILLALLGISLIIYQIFFTKQIYKCILKVQGGINNDYPVPTENECYQNLLKYKIIYYTIFIVLLLLSLIIGKYLELKAWILVYYIEWILGLFYMKLNFSLLTHFLNVKFVAEALDEIEKEFFIGNISIQDNRYLLKYRLLNKKIII